jgi:hypothetical protein
MDTICPSCHLPVPSDSFFCPNCGKPVKPKPLGVSVWKQIVSYSVSLFLPPLGFWYVWKYLKQPDALSKKIGIINLILSIISIIVTIWLTQWSINSVNQSINSMNNLNF